MFNRKRKQYVILVLSPKVGYFAKTVGEYASTQKLALKLSKKDAETLNRKLTRSGFVSAVLEYEGNTDNGA